MEFLDVRLAGDHVGGQVSKILMKLLVSCSTINHGDAHDHLVQEWCIGLFMKGIIILMWDESEFGIHGEGCHDALHHLIVLTSPCSLSTPVMNLLHPTLSFSEVI